MKRLWQPCIVINVTYTRARYNLCRGGR